MTGMYMNLIDVIGRSPKLCSRPTSLPASHVECRYLAIQSESLLQTTLNNCNAYSKAKTTLSDSVDDLASRDPSSLSLHLLGAVFDLPITAYASWIPSTSSLCFQTSFLIHNLRLNYLRNVEDPYGPRLISLSPSYTSNPYIIASNLADVERWPELAVPSSPAPSDDEDERGLDGRPPRGTAQQKLSGLANLNHHHERNGRGGVTEGEVGRGRPTGFPGAAGLQYTTTMMGGNRTGALGLRVSASGDKKTTDVRKAARRASARFERRGKTLSNGMGVGGRFEDMSVLEASDEDREGARSDGSAESKVAKVGVNIVGPSDGGDTSIIPKFTPPPPDVGAISAEVVANPHNGSNQNLAATPPKIIGFIPNFKGAAEMEARRRYRLQARGRGGPGGFGSGTRGDAQPTQPLSLRDVDTSSSSEPEPPSDVDKAQTSDEDASGNLPADTDSDESAAGEDSAEEDGFDSAPVIDGSMDLAHEFDPYVSPSLPPTFFISGSVSFSFHFVHELDDLRSFLCFWFREFSATRGGVNLGSVSDIASMLSVSHSLMSTPNESVHNPSGLPSRRGARLSPVTEHRIKDATRNRSPSSSGRNGSRPRHRNSASSTTGPHHPQHSDHHHKHSTGGGTGDNSTSGSRHHHSSTHHSSSGSKPDELTFPRRKVPPIRPVKSALTAMLAKTLNSTNPFEEYYAAISGRAEGESKTVAVYFPKATKPMGQVMELNVRKDATVEEVLGHALYRYWEEAWLPKIDEGLEGEEDSKWNIVCSAVGWIFRIAEEDGEVDEDFPPPDRTGKISKFNFDAYAVLGASTAQSMSYPCDKTAWTNWPHRNCSSTKQGARI